MQGEFGYALEGKSNSRCEKLGILVVFRLFYIFGSRISKGADLVKCCFVLKGGKYVWSRRPYSIRYLAVL